MNLVDCSQETIDKHWRRIRVEHKVEIAQDYSEEGETQSTIEHQVNIGTEHNPEHISGADWAVQKQDILGRWISKGLQSIFISMLKLDIPTDAFDDFSNLTAEMLGKYHPNLSAFEIIAKFERELMWGYAALMLSVAIFKGFKQKSIESKGEKGSVEKIKTVEGGLVDE